jgi:hypothetical protein
MKNESYRLRNSEAGQSAVLFALMLVGLVLFVALGIDGGNALNQRRVTQNGADSGALAGVHYMIGSDSPTETQLRVEVNSVIEAHGVPDTDGIPRNHVNDNITIYYTDDQGDRLTSQPCHILPCNSDPPPPGDPIPAPAQGLEVEVNNQVSTFFLGIIDQETVNVGAMAAAVARGGNAGEDLRDNGVIAFGICDEAEQPLDMSLYHTEVIGGIRSSSWFENRGNGNHYHGQVYYGEGAGYIDTASVPGYYEPDPPGEPQEAAPVGDPFAGLFTVEDFNCTDGSIGSDPDFICHDVSGAPLNANGEPEVSYQYLVGQGLLHPGQGRDPAVIEDGIYYAGDAHFRFGSNGLRGTVTLVTNATIKITENDVQLSGYMPADSPAPGLLMYSAFQMADPCEQFNANPPPYTVPINTTGTGSVRPRVYHNPDGTYQSHDLGSLQYNGLIYAPGGRVATSGEKASYVGAIVAYSFRINGYDALIVNSPYLFPVTQKLIYLND